MQNVVFLYILVPLLHTRTNTHAHTGTQKNAELKCLGLDAACKAVWALAGKLARNLQ